MSTGSDKRPEDPVLPDGGFGSVDDWSQFIGKDDAMQMLAGLSALGGSQDLLEQITAAVLPGNAPALSGRLSEEAVPAEELLRRSEQRFRSLVENLPAVAFIAGMGQGRSEVYINPYIEKLLGYTKEEWLRDPFLWYWRVHADDRELWNQEFARGLVTGGPWQADVRFLAADGKPIWVRGQATIVRDEQGRPLFLQGIAFDIGSIKDAEQRMRAQRDDAVRLIDLLPAPTIAFGSGDEVLCINGAARSALNLANGDRLDVAPFRDLAARARNLKTAQKGTVRLPGRELRAHAMPAPLVQGGGETAPPVLLTFDAPA